MLIISSLRIECERSTMSSIDKFGRRGQQRTKKYYYADRQVLALQLPKMDTLIFRISV
jgi:hypothetical protein